MPTKIEWATETWNPVTGCTPVSEGCANCYARRMHKRLRAMGQPKYQHDFEKVAWHPEELDRPLDWRKPRRVFVCSMSDLFHDDLPMTVIHEVLALACSEEARRHQFLILTKRPERWAAFADWASEFLDAEDPVGCCLETGGLPENLWLGVTVESAKHLDRVYQVLEIPAAIYWISHEPALGGPIDWPKEFLALGKRAWLVTGGEGGPGARPMHPDVPRHDRDQCNAAGVPFFFKQWGEWMPAMDNIRALASFSNSTAAFECIRPVREEFFFGESPHCVGVHRVGKKAAGRLLDGREWNEHPETKLCPKPA